MAPEGFEPTTPRFLKAHNFFCDFLGGNLKSPFLFRGSSKETSGFLLRVWCSDQAELRDHNGAKPPRLRLDRNRVIPVGSYGTIDMKEKFSLKIC